MVKVNEMEMNEEGVKALETLVKVAVKLKESGMLDMLYFLAEKSGDILTIISNDVGLARAGALGHAGISALEKLEPEEVLNVKTNLEELTSCAFKSLAEMKVDELKPAGLGTLLKAPSDKDLQYGLAMILALGKAMGKCLRNKQSS